MPPSKKLKSPRPVGTLHAFFSKAPVSSPVSTPPPHHKPLKASESSKARAGSQAKFVPAQSADIIVIDSDEEKTPLRPRGKRRNVQNENSDIEIVQGHSASTSRNPSNHKKMKRELSSSSEPELLSVEPSGRTTSPSFPPLSEPTELFGKPTTLLVSSKSTTPTHLSPHCSPAWALSTSPNTPADNAATPSRSGIEPSLSSIPKSLPDEPNSSRTESALPSCPSPALMQCATNDNQNVVELTDDIMEIDDEWGTGDDELARQQDDTPGRDDVVDQDEVEGIIDLDPDIPPDDVLKTCPFCSKSLAGLPQLNIGDHINNCADEPQTRPPEPPSLSTSAPGSSSFKAKQNSNAFSVLMSSHTENEAWKEASIAEDRNFRATKTSRRKAPFYKIMQGMPIAVDAFKYGIIPGVTAYFLTHAHSDHYTNLSSSWKAGPIYCSECTAKLIMHMLSVDAKWVHPLPMDTPVTIPDTGDVTVTLIEANHCPGSSLFLFEGRQTVNAGDSAYQSASPQHVLHPAVKGKRLDTVYLDTTYLNPKHTFPSQSQVISACAELAKKLVAGQQVSLTGGEKGSMQTMDKWCSVAVKKEDKDSVKLNRTLVVIGTYSIGKERIVKAIATALKTQIYCDSRKAAILRCQQDPELHGLLTKDPYAAGVHVVPLSVITSDRIKEYTERWKGHWGKAIGFRPTGWTYSPPAGANTMPTVSRIISHQPHGDYSFAHLRPMRNSTSTHQLFGVPYSEHSSFYELTCFALSLDWARIIATVNVESEASRGKIGGWIARWDAERKKRGKSVVPYRSVEYW